MSLQLLDKCLIFLNTAVLVTEIVDLLQCHHSNQYFVDSFCIIYLDCCIWSQLANGHNECNSNDMQSVWFATPVKHFVGISGFEIIDLLAYQN